MNYKILKARLRESILALSEMEVPSDMNDLVEKFATLSDQIDVMKAKLKEMETEYRKYSDVLKPLMSEVAEVGDVALRTEKFLITIKKKGYEYDRAGYQEAFQTLYSKVNPAIKRIADDILKANTTLVKVAPKLGVQKNDNITEINIMNTLKDKFIYYINKLSLRLDKNSKIIDTAVDEFKQAILKRSKK
jgi:hypothetical protein